MIVLVFVVRCDAQQNYPVGLVTGEVTCPLKKLKLIALFTNNTHNVTLNLTSKDHSQRVKTMV